MILISTRKKENEHWTFKNSHIQLDLCEIKDFVVEEMRKKVTNLIAHNISIQTGA